MTAEEEGIVVPVVVRLALFVGVMGIGLALGAHLGLQQLQTSCIQAGALPTPGARVTDPAVLQSMPCWNGAKRLQWIANTAGKASAVLLLGGGVLDRFEPEATAALGRYGAVARERLS